MLIENNLDQTAPPLIHAKLSRQRAPWTPGGRSSRDRNHPLTAGTGRPYDIHTSTPDRQAKRP